MTVLRKDPYNGFTLKKYVLGRQNQVSMAKALLLRLLRDPWIITVTTALSMDGENEPSQRLYPAAQGGGSEVTSVTSAYLHILWLAQRFPSQGPSFIALLTWGQA